jgi:hypothetical protein
VKSPGQPAIPLFKSQPRHPQCSKNPNFAKKDLRARENFANTLTMRTTPNQYPCTRYGCGYCSQFKTSSDSKRNIEQHLGNTSIAEPGREQNEYRAELLKTLEKVNRECDDMANHVETLSGAIESTTTRLNEMENYHRKGQPGGQSEGQPGEAAHRSQ